jgi:Na+-driven multidrug efflux pump
LPPLFSSMTRLFLFILPAILLSRTPGFQIRYVWYLSVASQSVQACINLLLLWRELQHKLSKALANDVIAPGSAVAS